MFALYLLNGKIEIKAKTFNNLMKTSLVYYGRNIYNVNDMKINGVEYYSIGRAYMTYFGLADKYFKGEPMKIFNNGDFENDLYRDFTYVDDILERLYF